MIQRSSGAPASPGLRDQAWFEMKDVRRRRLDGSAWIPLRERQHPVRVGEYGHSGFQDEVVLRASIAVPLVQRALAQHLDWHALGITDHRAYAEGDMYTPADVHRETRGPGAGLEAVRLVIQQPGNSAEQDEWRLHQDFVVALALRREDDIWVAQDEGYEPVVRLKRDERGRAVLLEVRAGFLKDYLAARRMALYVSSYRERVEVCEEITHITWPSDMREVQGLDRWQGRVCEIHEGGMAFGGKTAVFHASRTDVDPEDDVPVMGPPTDENVRSASWRSEDTRRKLYRVVGEFWRREWVEPGAASPRVRADHVTSAISFIVDAAGRKVHADDLSEEDDFSSEGRWLWFRPELIEALVTRRGGSLIWYRRDTGSVGCSPDYGVHFGMNELGWVTVYAKDVASLPEWQRQLWTGFNAVPDGGVSRELLAAQVNAEPAATFAAEDALSKLLQELDRAATAQFGFPLLHPHEHQAEALVRIHRFRACDRKGLYALAKDVARVTADAIDAKAIQSVVAPPKGETWGGLKSLEKLLARSAGPDRARLIMGPLAGVYDLRLADAHPEGSGIDDAMKLAQVDPSLPPVLQGRQLLESTVAALVNAIAEFRGCEQASSDNV